MKMGEKLPPRTKFDNFGKLLTLPVVEERDGGKYMCTVKNSAGEAVHYFDVIVEGRSTAGANCARICRHICFCFKEKAVDTGVALMTQHSSSFPRAAKVADRASSEPADCDWV